MTRLLPAAVLRQLTLRAPAEFATKTAQVAGVMDELVRHVVRDVAEQDLTGLLVDADPLPGMLRECGDQLDEAADRVIDALQGWLDRGIVKVPSLGRCVLVVALEEGTVLGGDAAERPSMSSLASARWAQYAFGDQTAGAIRRARSRSGTASALSRTSPFAPVHVWMISAPLSAYRKPHSRQRKGPVAPAEHLSGIHGSGSGQRKRAGKDAHPRGD